MKRVEIILLLISIISLVFNFLLLPMGLGFSLLSLGTLATFYFIFSLSLFNGGSIKSLFAKERTHSITLFRKLLSQATGFSIACIIIGVLFSVFYWQGPAVNLLLGLSLLFIIAVISSYSFLKFKDKYYLSFLKRIGGFGLVGCVFLFLPQSTWIELKYSKYPAYLEAFKKAKANPENDEYWKALREESKKISDE